MNFLMRTAQTVVPEQSSVHDSPSSSSSVPKTKTTLEGLIAEDPFPDSEDDDDRNGSGAGSRTSSFGASSVKNYVPIVDKHCDVTEKEGWITIPYKELPENWNDAPDILSLRSLDRSFVFPGEQIHLLACLSASKQDTEIITPFKVAAVMSKNGILGHNSKQKKDGVESNSVLDGEENNIHKSGTDQSIEQNGESLLNKEKMDATVDIFTSESLLRMEDHKKQTESQLASFKNSHFFVRIAESDEPLWSKRSGKEPLLVTSDLAGDKLSETGKRKTPNKDTHLNAYIDRGSFNANVSGGLSRNAVKCCSLANGDLVVLLQVNVGINSLKDPVLEILQFEKFEDRSLGSVNPDNLVNKNQKDPCGDLLKWLLPLDRAISPPARPASPPPLSSGAAFSSVSYKSSFSASSSSQLFSFGNFRSYSMSSLPQNTAPPPATPPSGSKPAFDLDDWGRHSPQKSLNSQDAGNANLLSFRGVPLEPDRFSVHCGLEGIYIPGRRWKKKLEIIQPVEIHSFAAECNAEDLLCVQIKNISPPHIPDVVIFLDSIAIVFEEAPKGGPPVSLPIACVEAGNDHSLPNLSLRRNEEHSFILKPAASMWRNIKAHNERSPQPSHSQSGGAIPNLYLPPKTGERIKTSSSADQYAVLVSCRCNYTESRLFFKQPTSWRPRVARDLMISVASEMSEQSLGSHGGLTQLPVQVLTLQASNLTARDLTLTVLAPALVTSPPSVVSVNSTPSTPMSPFVGFSEFAGKFTGEKRSGGMQRISSMPQVSDNQKEKVAGAARSVSFDEQTVPVSDVVPANGLGFTHLWLQSTVPLGCVPSRSTATVKLELLPLTDGIITLDTLQINVKEKGRTYIPEHSLKINATSSIATGIV